MTYERVKNLKPERGLQAAFGHATGDFYPDGGGCALAQPGETENRPTG